MKDLERLIKTCVELGTAQTLETLGVTSGEISQRKAIATYHKWFADADKAGRIKPVRVDNKTKWYRVVDILSLKAYDAARVDINF